VSGRKEPADVIRELIIQGARMVICFLTILVLLALILIVVSVEHGATMLVGFEPTRRLTDLLTKVGKKMGEGQKFS
jgi:hypothetical protein